MTRVQDLLARVDAARAGASSPRRRQLVLGVAGVALVVGAVAAWASRPDVPTDPRPTLLLLALVVVVPAHIVLNGAELLLMARIGRTRMPLGEAARVTVLSSAANLLPIPGAIVVRTRALQRLGSSGRHALSVAVVVGLGWVATSCAVAGVLLWATDPGRAALGFTVAGLLGLVATWVLLGRYPARRDHAFAALLLVEVASTLVGGLRVLLAIRGLGYDVGFPAGVALSLSGPLASLVGVFPGGLGLREAIAAGLAPLVGVAASVALLATVVDRLLGAAVQAVLGVVLLVAPGVRRRLTAEVLADEDRADLELADPSDPTQGAT